MTQARPRAAAPRATLSLFDSISLIVGIIVGAGIYQVAPDVARGSGGPWLLLALWAFGGLLSLAGAVAYAELASAYPEEGGDYVYLTRAYGRWAGFLFGWLQLVIVRPGDIAVMAFAFATYARAIADPFGNSDGDLSLRLYAGSAVLLLTLVNVLGVRAGKTTQNFLTVIKVLGLLAVVLAAYVARPERPQALAPEPMPASVALILVLFTFGGWNEMAYVAAEVRDRKRNIARALVGGTLAVTLIYLLVNLAFLRALGFEGVASSEAVASDAVAGLLPGLGAAFVSALICVSALGAVNGLILAGSRISYALGTGHPLFGALGHWDRRRDSPVRALLVQGAIALLLILALGSFVDTLLYTAPAVYAFYVATSLALIVLRRREPARSRPFRVPLYPLPVLIFAATCTYLVYAAVAYRPQVALSALGLLLLGLPLYRLSVRIERKETPET